MPGAIITMLRYTLEHKVTLSTFLPWKEQGRVGTVNQSWKLSSGCRDILNGFLRAIDLSVNSGKVLLFQVPSQFWIGINGQINVNGTVTRKDAKVNFLPPLRVLLFSTPKNNKETPDRDHLIGLPMIVFQAKIHSVFFFSSIPPSLFSHPRYTGGTVSLWEQKVKELNSHKIPTFNLPAPEGGTIPSRMNSQEGQN